MKRFAAHRAWHAQGPRQEVRRDWTDLKGIVGKALLFGKSQDGIMSAVAARIKGKAAQ